MSVCLTLQSEAHTLFVRLLASQEYEPAVGRVLVFSIDGQGADRKVNLVAEEETRGPVYALNGFNGKLLAGINSKVRGRRIILSPSVIFAAARAAFKLPIYRGHCLGWKAVISSFT